jgi:hypothetical protein
MVPVLLVAPLAEQNTENKVAIVTTVAGSRPTCEIRGILMILVYYFATQLSLHTDSYGRHASILQSENV